MVYLMISITQISGSILKGMGQGFHARGSAARPDYDHVVTYADTVLAHNFYFEYLVASTPWLLWFTKLNLDISPCPFQSLILAIDIPAILHISPIVSRPFSCIPSFCSPQALENGSLTMA